LRGTHSAADRIEKFHRQPFRRTLTRKEPRAIRDGAPTSASSILSTRPRKTVDALMKLDLAAGVDVEIKL